MALRWDLSGSNPPNAMNTNPNNDHMISPPPSDTVSNVQFHPFHDRFIVSSWDNSVSMYEFFGSNQSKGLCKRMFNKPVLDCCFDEKGDYVFTAGCDNTIQIWNPQSNQVSPFGQHQAPVRCILFSKSPNGNFVISGSWDRTFSFWDPRSSGNGTGSETPVFRHNLGAKVFAMAQKANMLVVGTSDTDIKTFDLRQSGKQIHSVNTEQKSIFNNHKQIKLNTQIKCIDIFPDCRGFAAGSIGGRVVIKHFDRNQEATKDFSFKCHRQGKHGQYVFAVNGIKFHQQSGHFTTAGSDGEMVTWDKEKRAKTGGWKAITTNRYGPPSSGWNGGSEHIDVTRMPIVTLDYHANGRYLVYATSYDYSKGIQYVDPTNQKPNVYLHEIGKK